MTTRLIRAIGLFVLFCSTQLAHAVVINEIRIDQTGADSDEFFELFGSAGENLDGLSYLVIGDQSSNQGYIEAVVDLSGYRLGSDGFFLAAESSFSLYSDIDLVTSLNFENNDNVTHLLVRDFSGHLRDDIDSNDDGVIDTTLWSSVIDSVSLLANSNGGDLTYSSTRVGPLEGNVPAHIFRHHDGSGDWQTGSATAGASDSPRLAKITEVPNEVPVARVPEPSSLMLLGGGLLLLGNLRRQATRHAVLTV